MQNYNVISTSNTADRKLTVEDVKEVAGAMLTLLVSTGLMTGLLQLLA